MRFLYTILFIELYCLIIYPTWYTPDNIFILKLFFFHFYYIAILLQVYIINKIVDLKKVDINYNFFKPDLSFFIIVLIYLAGIIPFINYPVLTKLDDHFHTAFPAAFVCKIDDIIIRISSGFLNIQIISWLLVFCLLLLFIFLKRKTLQYISPYKILFILYPMFLIYFFFLSYNQILDRFGKVIWFHRYPPVGKTLFAISYSLFTIENWGGRLTQIIFNILSLYILYRLCDFLPFKNKISRLFTLSLFIFNPLFWNIIYLNHLEQGSVFFILIIIYFFLRWNENLDLQKDKYLLLFWLFFCTALFYKQLIIFLFPIIVLYYIFQRNVHFKKRAISFLKALSVPLIIFIPYFIFDKLYGISPAGILFSQVNSLFSPFITLFQTAVYSGFGLTVLLVAGFIYSLLFIKNSYIKFLYIFTIFYLLLINITNAWTFIRHILPVYIPLAVFIAILLDNLYSYSKKLTFIILIFVFCEMFYLNFLSSENELITFRTKEYYDVDYEDLSRYIKSHGLYNDKIYAPNACEPSHFYFYKHKIPTDNLIRIFWCKAENQNIINLYNFLKDSKIKYLVVLSPDKKRITRYNKYFLNYFQTFNPLNTGYPGASYFWNGLVNSNLQAKLFYKYQNYGFQLIESFGNNQNTILLLKTPGFLLADL
ncbi:MAG: glycosyltransferase family 39 protein [Candidatus Hydrogenedentota bacterium]